MHRAPTELEGGTADAGQLQVGGLADVPPDGHHVTQDSHFPLQLAKLCNKGGGSSKWVIT